MKLKFAMTEETVTNVRLELDEVQHRDITPNQSVCQQIKNLAVTAEEIAENPEYIKLRRSIAVQTVRNEEIIIPKLDPAPSHRSDLTVVCTESGSSMEIDISSQESVMDIASQESLSTKESNSEEPKCCDHGASAQGEELLMKEEALRKREEAVLESQERLRICEEVVANRQRAVLQLEMEVQKHQEMLNYREAQLADRELILKKLETAIKIRELEAEGYKVIPLCSESNDCLPAKRTKKN